MTRGAGRQQNNFTKGVLDPRLVDRGDLEQYYQGLSGGLNVIVRPQGGVARRGGGVTKGRLRRQLRAVPLTASMITAPNGGTIANLLDQQAATNFTTAIISGDPFVVFQIDLSAAQTIAAVDLENVSVATTGADDAVKVQWSSDGVTWSDFGGPVNVRTSLRTRRMATAPGGAQSARYWRMVVVGGVATGATTLTTVRLWVEKTICSAVRRLPFAFSDSETYQIFATDRNADVYRDGVWKSAIALPYRSSQLREIDNAQSHDTLLLFHHEVIWMCQRQGADDEWQSQLPTFTNVDTQSTSPVYSGGQDERQQIKVAGIADGEAIILTCEFLETVPVTKSSDAGAMATALVGALEGLPNIAAGIAVTVDLADATNLDFTVDFVGGANAARFWPLIRADVVGNDGVTVTTTSVVQGRDVSSGAPIFGTKQGWPRCATWFQDRLWMGGLYLFPHVVVASKLADYFNFDTDQIGASAKALTLALDADEVVNVLKLHSGRHLQCLTDFGEFYVTTRVIDATQPVVFVLTTTFGSKPGAPVVGIEGGTLYIQSGGAVIRDMLWDDAQADYAGGAASLLASHLISDAISLTHRPAAETSEGSLLLVVNADGSGAVMTMLRDQDVAGWSKLSHGDGLWRDFLVDGARRIWAAVERTVSGQTDVYLEEIVEGVYGDATVRQTFASPTTVIGGLTDLEGKTVWAMADGTPAGPFTVASGQITLATAATVVDVGIDFAPSVTTMPMLEKLQDDTVLRRKKRIHTVRASVYRTGNFRVTANDADSRKITVDQFGAVALDTPMMSKLLTEEVVVPRLLGSSDNGLVTIDQPTPGPLEVMSLVLEVN